VVSSEMFLNPSGFARPVFLVSHLKKKAALLAVEEMCFTKTDGHFTRYT